MTPLVLIPGMMCDARLFAPQIGAFSGDRTIILAPISAYDNVEALAADILDNSPDRFAMAGLSMGGIVAMEILRQAPKRVEKIALLDTNPLAELEEVKSKRVPQMAKVEVGNLDQVMRDEMKPKYLSNGPNRQQHLDLCMQMAKDLGAQVFLNQSRALMDRPDQTDTLWSADIPALVLCGVDDALCPVSRHEFMAEILPNAQLEIINGAGHLPTIEQPELTNAAVKRWLDV